MGSPLAGYLNDHHGGGSSTSKVLLFIHIFAYSTIIIYNEIHIFGLLSFLVTFALGLQDGAITT